MLCWPPQVAAAGVPMSHMSMQCPQRPEAEFRARASLETAEKLTGAKVMSCWVVPTIAADLWGCTVENVWAAIRDGRIPTREENGWLFVDAAPHGADIALPRPLRPATFTPV